jgi:hypothetical protein
VSELDPDFTFDVSELNLGFTVDELNVAEVERDSITNMWSIKNVIISVFLKRLKGMARGK